jgi:hypothetical protein
LPIHPKLLQDSQANDQTLREGSQVQMEPTLRRSLSHFEDLLTTTPVLAQPNIEKLFDVYCDAFDMNIGGVLMQDGRAIAYASR